MDRSAWAFGLVVALLVWHGPAPCLAQPPPSKSTSTANPPELLPPLKPLTDPYDDAGRPVGNRRTLRPAEQGPTPIEIEAERLARTSPWSPAMFAPHEAWPAPTITATAAPAQLWPAPAPGSGKRDLSRYWSSVTAISRPTRDSAVRLSRQQVPLPHSTTMPASPEALALKMKSALSNPRTSACPSTSRPPSD